MSLQLVIEQFFISDINLHTSILTNTESICFVVFEVRTADT